MAERVTRRGLLRLIGGGMAAALLAACTPKVVEKIVKETVIVQKEVVVEKEAPVKTVAPVTLRFHFRICTQATDMENVWAPQFMKEYPNIKLKIEPLGDYWTKVPALYSVGELGDVIWTDSGACHRLASRSMTLPLNELIDAERYDMTDYIPRIIEDCTWDGKIHALPWEVHPGDGGLLYNVDMLHEAGLTDVTEDPATLLGASWGGRGFTHADLKAAALKMTKDTNGDGRLDTFGCVPGIGYHIPLENHAGAFGGSFMDKECKKCTIDSPETMAALNWIRGCFVGDEVVAPAPGTGVDNGVLFSSGKLATLATGYWGYMFPGPAAIGDKFKWGLTLIPDGPAGRMGTMLTMGGFSIPNITKEPQAAWEVVKWMERPAFGVQMLLNHQNYCPLGRYSVLHNQQIMDTVKGHKVMAMAIESPQTQPWKSHEPWNLRWDEFTNTLTQACQEIWAGGKTVEEAVPGIKASLQQILDKPPL